MRLVLLNGVVVRPGMAVFVSEADAEEVRDIAPLARSYIGHAATARLLGVEVNRGEYEPEEGDLAYVVRLKRRAQRPGDVEEVTWEDLEVLKLAYYKTGRIVEKVGYVKWAELTPGVHVRFGAILRELPEPSTLVEARRVVRALERLARRWGLDWEDLSEEARARMEALWAKASVRRLVPEAFEALEAGREESGTGPGLTWSVRLLKREPGYIVPVRVYWDGDEWRDPDRPRSRVILEFSDIPRPEGVVGEGKPAERRTFGLFVQVGSLWLTEKGEVEEPEPYRVKVFQVELGS